MKRKTFEGKSLNSLFFIAQRNPNQLRRKPCSERPMALSPAVFVTCVPFTERSAVSMMGKVFPSDLGSTISV